MKIPWLETFETGHAVIDGQHRELVDIINVVGAGQLKGDIAEGDRLLESFVEIVKNHFKTEERILAETDFPGLEEHCIYHRQLLKQAEHARSLLDEAGAADPVEECFRQMAAFFVDDVVRWDGEFVSHLIETGRVPTRMSNS